MTVCTTSCKSSKNNQRWGVQHIWLVEPELKKLYVYDNGSLSEVSCFLLPEFDLEIAAAELFA